MDIGYGSEADTAVLELTHNLDTPAYDLGNGFGHIAIEVPDAYQACDNLRHLCSNEQELVKSAKNATISGFAYGNGLNACL